MYNGCFRSLFLGVCFFGPRVKVVGGGETRMREEGDVRWAFGGFGFLDGGEIEGEQSRRAVKESSQGEQSRRAVKESKAGRSG